MKKTTISSLHPKLFSSIFILIIAISMAGFLMGQGANAGTSVYLDTIGAPVSLAGIGAITFSFASALSRIIAGALIDAKGRAVIMVIGSLFMIVGSSGPLLINSDALFIVWRILQGIGFSAVTTAAATAAADVLPAARLGEGIGYYGLGQAVAMSIGPALAIFLISTNPPENFYIGLTLCSVLACVLSLLCTYEKHPERLPDTSEYCMRFESGQISKRAPHDNTLANEAKATPAAPLNKQTSSMRAVLDSIFEPGAIPGTLPMMCIATSFGFGIFFVGLFGSTIDVSNSGFFFSLAAVSMIAIRLLSGKFMDKIAPIKIMGIAVLSGLATFGILFVCSHLEPGATLDTLFYLAGFFYGACLGIAMPINQTIAIKQSPAHRWGAANGLFLLGIDISIGTASFVWGITNEQLGFDVTILIVMGFIVLSFFVALLSYPKHTV